MLQKVHMEVCREKEKREKHPVDGQRSLVEFFDCEGRIL